MRMRACRLQSWEQVRVDHSRGSREVCVLTVATAFRPFVDENAGRKENSTPAPPPKVSFLLFHTHDLPRLTHMGSSSPSSTLTKCLARTRRPMPAARLFPPKIRLLPQPSRPRIKISQRRWLPPRLSPFSALRPARMTHHLLYPNLRSNRSSTQIPGSGYSRVHLTRSRQHQHVQLRSSRS